MSISLIVNLSCIALIALFGVIGFIFKFKKNGYALFGSLLDLVFVILNVIISVFLSGWVADLLVTPEMLYNILDMVNGDATEGTLAEIVAQMEISLQEGEFLASADLDLVFAIFEVILTPIIFIAVFFIVGLLLWIIKRILLCTVIPKTENFALRVAGGCVAVLKNTLVIAIYLAPIIGFATYGVNTVHAANEKIKIDGLEEIDSFVTEYEEIVTEGALGVISDCGGQWLFEMLSTTHIDDVEVSLVDETENALNIYEAIVPLTQISSIDFTAKEADLIDAAVDEIDKSEYLTAMVASVMSQASEELLENDSLLGFARPILGDSFDPVLDKMLEIWAQTDRAGLVDDLRTYSTVFRSTVKYGLYKQIYHVDGDIFIVLENSGFYSEILQALHKNERTRPVVPTLANALQSYLYEVYEEINGEPYGTGEVEKVDEGKINESSLNEESVRIATAVSEIRKFSESTAEIVYVEDIVKEGDFVALGTGLNQIRDSVFFSNSYRFLISSILHSEACSKLGIFDSNFVENATKPGADMVQLLVSRQHLAMLTMAMWDGDKMAQEDALKVLISSLAFDPDDATDKANAEAEMYALKELAALENLEKYGVGGEKGNTVSSITESLVDTIHDHNYTDKDGDGDVDQDDIDAEAADTAHIITAIANSQNYVDGAVNVFDAGDGSSKTGESAEVFVSNVLKSTIATEMIDTAINENDVDPYGIQGTLSESDKSSVEAALTAEYRSGADKEALENLATVFGVTLNP